MYASEDTWSGPDDYLWDADDELVFMARHLEGKHTTGGESSLPPQVQIVSYLIIRFYVTNQLSVSFIIAHKS